MAKVKRLKLGSVVLATVLSILCLPVHAMASVAAEDTEGYPHGINITYYGDPYTQRGVTWVTQKDVASSEVEVVEKTEGLKEEEIDWTTARRFAGTTEHTKGENYLAWCNPYKAVITGLTPGKQYYYRIVAHKQNTKAYSQKIGIFTMADKNSDSVKFVAFTDQQQSDKGGYEAVNVVLKSAMDTAP
ncbi:MAG: fibronectin type III domain-containing protein, partial [Clostridia bacterium]|nr:fibronectin type III domain-containing protein [Clostridia bacterium]